METNPNSLHQMSGLKMITMMERTIYTLFLTHNFLLVHGIIRFLDQTHVRPPYYSLAKYTHTS